MVFGVGGSGLESWGVGIRIWGEGVRWCLNMARAMSMTCPEGVVLEVWGLVIRFGN